MIKQLQWDTDFFGYKVGQAIVVSENINRIPELLEEANEYRLVYIISDQKINLGGKKLKLVDIKTMLVKEVLKKENCNEKNVIEYNGGREEVLKDLALQSGIYSRFKRDSNFKNKEFERIYIKWIQDSINKKLADTLLVYEQENICKGFITLTYKMLYAEIGLIAIEERSRGKGMGLSLLSVANNLSYEKGLTHLQVTTQFENTPAMRLYGKAGYKIISKKYVYHLWN